MSQQIPSLDSYVERIADQYQQMLANESLEESSYQKFFEQNPCILSGLTPIGGQGVLLDALISQPKIQFSDTRIPDFVWLTRNSLDFCPTFIEIEKPSKECFKQNQELSSAFHEAHDQLGSWKALLTNDDTKRSLFDVFSLPKDLLDLNFKPSYVLIIGRRSQWENSQRKIRTLGVQSNDGFTKIHSFDHIAPTAGSILPYIQSIVTCRIKKGQLSVISIPDALTLCPTLRDSYARWSNFHEALDANLNIDPERKKYLHRTFDEIVEGRLLPENFGPGKCGKRNVRL